MKPALLVLAAGMGSRYGSLKQMDGLGPSGETIIDYSIYDAVKAGFGKVVYIVRESFLDAFRESVLKKYEGVRCPDGEPLAFDFVTQELDKLPEGFTPPADRVKPWGTAHAILMAKDRIDVPFTVINGDDFYGRESFRIAGEWCRKHENGRGVYAIVGFEIDKTLSESGGVSRGICHYGADRMLTGVVEHHDVKIYEDGVLRGNNSVSGQTVELAPKDLCSMNMWGFTPDYFEGSAEAFRGFLAGNSTELKKEFYIPYAVDCMIKAGKAACEVLATPSSWFGVTFREDRPGVVARLAALTADGSYPSPLYSAE